ncbi:MAG TPA: glycosyltransferase family 2 protein [Candidatus Saccharimonadales bacterium]|nr:glycosyltransferase family 2 protein [Candidatus Saccharimonadales bacterium]
MKNLSIALATYNEENNLRACLESVKDISSEIVIVDGSSTDKTIEIASEFGAKVKITNNPPIFHINKQKALDMAKNEWILQLDADERVSPELAIEIKKVIEMSDEELEIHEKNLPGKKLFHRHQKLLEQRDGSIGTDNGSYVAFFIPRLNYFLGRYLRYGGVYPDGAIRLFKKSSARFPAKDVHELIEINGKVGWLQNPLFHIDSPTFERYLKRNNRYTDLMAVQLKNKKIGFLTSADYLFFQPSRWFALTYIRHKGFMDGWQGFVFSFYSALRFPISYLKYLKLNEKNK